MSSFLPTPKCINKISFHLPKRQSPSKVPLPYTKRSTYITIKKWNLLSDKEGFDVHHYDAHNKHNNKKSSRNWKRQVRALLWLSTINQKIANWIKPKWGKLWSNNQDQLRKKHPSKRSTPKWKLLFHFQLIHNNIISQRSKDKLTRPSSISYDPSRNWDFKHSTYIPRTSQDKVKSNQDKLTPQSTAFHFHTLLSFIGTSTNPHPHPNQKKKYKNIIFCIKSTLDIKNKKHHKHIVHLTETSPNDYLK